MRRFGFAALAALAVAACGQSAPKSSAPAPVASATPAVTAAPVTSSAAPAAPAYVGAWAASASACTLPQDDPDAPTVFTAKGYEQFESECVFETVTPIGGNEWNVKGRCATAINQDGAFKLKVEGDTLTLYSERGSLAYVRCPKS